MVKLKFFLAIALMSFAVVPLESNWQTDIDLAKAKAQKENKLILMSFSGSDWCSNCIRLDKTLFQSEEFKSYAQENLVLLKVDFPAKKANKLSNEQTAHNEGLAEQYNKKGAFPTVLILDAKGEVKGKLQHPLNSVDEYMKSLKNLVNQ